MGNDRRIKKTDKAIRKAFIDLLSGKPFAEITIQDIADKADISRSTFYDHYTDKYQLIDTIYSEITERFFEMAEIYFNPRSHEDKKMMARKALDRVIGDADSIRVLMNLEEPGWDLASRIQTAMKPMCLKYLEKEDRDKFNLGNEFVAGFYTFTMTYSMQWIAEHQNIEDFPGMLELSTDLSSFFYKRDGK